ncbi:MAG: nucleoside-diphosphate kinase [Candidatus Pacebacteria bacterium]|nr:nucleoside-diphosphate kinase [Candidatus Paceibacterota bacterium]
MGKIAINSAPFSVLVIKPDLIFKQKGHQVLGAVLKKGFDFGNRKVVHKTLDIEQAKLFYPFDEVWGKKIGGKLKSAYNELSLSCIELFNTENDVELGKIVIGWVWRYITSGPITAVPVYNKERNEWVINQLKDTVGDTDPSEANEKTLRALFCPGESLLLANKSQRAIENGIHCSASISDALREAEALGFTSH